jgi:hypothetical protein
MRRGHRADSRPVGPRTVYTIQNAHLVLSVDGRGRMVSLRNLATGTELIAHPEAAEAWRLVVPSGRHTVDFVLGSEQKPRIEVASDGAGQRLLLSYERLRTPGGESLPIRARFCLRLAAEAPELEARVELDNRSRQSIDEVEFPIIGGLGGFPARGGKRVANLLAACDWGDFFGDVLNGPLPVTGRECGLFVREHETAIFEQHRGNLWVDLWGDGEGLFLMHRDPSFADFAVKIERYPSGQPHGAFQAYPPGTPRWLRLYGLHVPRVPPGRKWVSKPVVVMAHRGQWHAGADRYAASRHQDLEAATPPAWTRQFTGWTCIMGKTYLGEVFYDCRKVAREAVADKKVTGIDLIYYYGHTELGCEGADLDQSPAKELGGERGFRAMVEKLHRNGCRLMLLDHSHRWVNRDIPEYRALRLDRHAIRDKQGGLVTARWWKETFLSCRRLAGPTPVWVEMCPTSEQWRQLYLKHITRMIERGVDGLDLDTFNSSSCFCRRHAHPPGEIQDCKLRFVQAVREHAKRLNPDFLIIGETMRPEALAVVDGFFPCPRYDNGENGNIYRYLFPQAAVQVVKVCSYDYAHVNRALGLGLGIHAEISGLRQTAREACPELAAYMGEVNRFRKQYAPLMLSGRYRDTLGARVEGPALFSVLEAQSGDRALVLRNPTAEAVTVRASLEGAAGKRLRLWRAPAPLGSGSHRSFSAGGRPGAGEQPLSSLPVAVRLPAFGAAVILALQH